MSSEVPAKASARIGYQLLIILCALLTGFLLAQWWRSVPGLEITFHNNSEQMITSLQLDFGSADSQSRIYAYRIPPGDKRILVLNHEPGMGFNVLARFKNGAEQSFCALRGDERWQAEVYLQP